MKRKIGHLLKRSTVLVVVSLLLDWLIINLLPSSGHAYPFWPSAGVAVGMVIADGAGLLPSVWLSSFLLNLFLNPANPSLGFVLALGITLQTHIAATFGKRVSGSKPKLLQTKEIVVFLIAIGPLSCLVGASVSAIASKAFLLLIPEQLLSSALTWWAGDVMGIVVLTPITLMLLPEMRDEWEGRRLKIAIPTLILVLFTQISFSQALTIDQQKALSSLKENALETSQLLTNNLERYSEIVDSLRRFELSSQHVSPDEFYLFTHEIFDRYPGLHGLSWNPVITQEERENFEKLRAKENGTDDFQIMEKSVDGSMVPAGDRQRYVPVSLIEPLAPNKAAVGYDILSNPSRAISIRAAELSNTLQATSPIELVQEKGNQQGILVLDPTRNGKGELQGFAVGILRMGDMLRSSFLSEISSENMRWTLSTADNKPLATYGNADKIAKDWIIKTAIPYAGKLWQLSLEPSLKAINTRLSNLPQQLLFACSLLLCISQAFLLVITARDQEQLTQAKLSRIQAMHDPLTSLLNRRGFHASLKDAIDESRMGGIPNTLLYIDLDHFKPINDLEGHKAGDAVLVNICNTISNTIRSNDVFGRIGGDEFALILKDCPTSNAQQIGEKLLEEIRALLIIFNQNRYKVTASIGLLPLASSNLSCSTIDEIMHQADLACYQAKHSGRDQIVTFG